MITLDDVRRIKEILRAHCEWIDADAKRSRVTEDGVFEWVTCSCSGETIAALIDDEFDVYIWPSVRNDGFLEIHIS